MTSDGAQRPEPAPGEGSPSWTPHEPNRPLLPKKGSFGVSKTFPLPDNLPPEEPDGHPDR